MTISSIIIEDGIREAILLAGTNTEVIFYYPNAPRPAFPYTSIQYLTVTPEINDWDEFDSDDDLNKQYGYRDVVFTINCYGDNALDQVSILQGNLRKQTVRDALRTYLSASITELSGISDLTTLISSDFEQRATIDVTVAVNMEDGSSTDNTGYFDTVEPIDWTNEP